MKHLVLIKRFETKYRMKHPVKFLGKNPPIGERNTFPSFFLDQIAREGGSTIKRLTDHVLYIQAEIIKNSYGLNNITCYIDRITCDLPVQIDIYTYLC